MIEQNVISFTKRPQFPIHKNIQLWDDIAL